MDMASLGISNLQTFVAGGGVHVLQKHPQSFFAHSARGAPKSDPSKVTYRVLLFVCLARPNHYTFHGNIGTICVLCFALDQAWLPIALAFTISN